MEKLSPPTLMMVPMASPSRTPPKSPSPSPRRKNNPFLTKVPAYLDDVPRPLGDSPNEASVLRSSLEPTLEEFDTPKSSKVARSRLQRSTSESTSEAFQPAAALSFSDDSGTVDDETTKTVKPFYVRNGEAMAPSELNTFLMRLESEFESITEFVGPLGTNAFKTIARLCRLPRYIGYNLYDAVEKFSNEPVLNFECFEKFYRAMVADNNDLPSKLMFILTTSIHGEPRDVLKIGDLYPLFNHIVRRHPSFWFMHEHIDICSSYAHVCEALCFFTISGRNTISLPQLRASNFCADIQALDSEHIDSEDITMLSYKQFYVVRTMFDAEEISFDHTLMYSEFLNFDKGGFNKIVVRRYMNQFDTSGITVSDFAVFLFAHHEKNHPSSIRFWFRLCDLDDDGYLTFEDLYELYADIIAKLMRQYENFSYVCAVDYILKAADCIKPVDDIKTMRISCSDIIKSGKAEEFFDYFVHAWNAHALEIRDNRESWENQNSKWQVFYEDKYDYIVQDERKKNAVPDIETQPSHPIDEEVCDEVLECMSDFGFFGESA